MDGTIIMTWPNRAKQGDLRRTKARPRYRFLSAGWWTPFRASIASLLATIAFISGLFNFLPRVALEVSPSSSPDNVYAVTAVITNSGYVPLMDVRLLLGICRIQIGNAELVGANYRGGCKGPLATRFGSTIWEAEGLEIDGKKSVNLADMFDILSDKGYGSSSEGPKKGGDISIIVNYRPAFWPLRMEKEFGLTSRRQADGSLIWLHSPR